MRYLPLILSLCLTGPLCADEVADLKIELAIAEVRAQRLESLLQAKPEPSVEYTPEVPDLTVKPTPQPQIQYVTRQVQKSRLVRKPKYCSAGKICGYYMVREYYTDTEQVPVAVQADPADTYATPLDIGGRILDYMRPSSPKTLLDLGSGDGRMVVGWATRFGYPAIGIESDPERVAIARNFAKVKGVSHLVKFIEGDFTKISWPAADVIYLYQFPDVMGEVSDRLKHYDQVVSFSHEVPGLPMKSHDNGYFYSWSKPRPTRLAQRPVAYWNGRPYTAPVCNNPRCTMCATIRAQLGM